MEEKICNWCGNPYLEGMEGICRKCWEENQFGNKNRDIAKLNLMTKEQLIFKIHQLQDLNIELKRNVCMETVCQEVKKENMILRKKIDELREK
jgi:hypothetical protein